MADEFAITPSSGAHQIRPEFRPIKSVTERQHTLRYPTRSSPGAPRPPLAAASSSRRWGPSVAASAISEMGEGRKSPSSNSSTARSRRGGERPPHRTMLEPSALNRRDRTALRLHDRSPMPRYPVVRPAVSYAHMCRTATNRPRLLLASRWPGPSDPDNGLSAGVAGAPAAAIVGDGLWDALRRPPGSIRGDQHDMHKPKGRVSTCVTLPLGI